MSNHDRGKTVAVPAPLTKSFAREILADAAAEVALANAITVSNPAGGDWDGYGVLDNLRAIGFDVVPVQS